MAKNVTSGPSGTGAAKGPSHDWLSIVSAAMSTVVAIIGISFFAGGEWKDYQAIKAAVIGHELTDRKLLVQELDAQTSALRAEFDTKIKQATARSSVVSAPEKAPLPYKFTAYHQSAETNRARDLTLGAHRFCFLSRFGSNNEEINRATNCVVSEEDGIWQLRATGAYCSSTCVD